MQEIWKTINGFEDYQISNFGRVKSLKKWHGTNERVLKPYKDSGGYFHVKLCKNGKPKNKQIYTLMYESFNNYKLKENECIHHIDFTKDNYLDNFQMMTISEHHKLHTDDAHHPRGMLNKKHSEKTKKLMSENHADFKGEHHPMSILTEQDVIKIRRLLDEGILTQRQIAKIFRIKQNTISNIKCGKIWNTFIGDKDVK